METCQSARSSPRSCRRCVSFQKKKNYFLHAIPPNFFSDSETSGMFLPKDATVVLTSGPCTTMRAREKTPNISCLSALSPTLLSRQHTLRLGSGMSVIIMAMALVDGSVLVSHSSSSLHVLIIAGLICLSHPSLTELSRQAYTLQNVISSSALRSFSWLLGLRSSAASRSTPLPRRVSIKDSCIV